MAFFQRNVNILHNIENMDADVAAIAASITAALGQQGWEPSGGEGRVERTTLIAPHGPFWLTIVDDAFDEGPDAASEFADAIRESIPRPLLIVQINDNAVDELLLCHRGRTGLVPAEIEVGWQIPTEPPWSALLADRRLHLDESHVYHDLESITESLGLAMTSWEALATEYEREPTGGAILLEFRKAGSVASENLSSSPKAEISSAPMIPAFLCGHPKEVKRRWKKIMSKLLKTKSWGMAMEGEQFIPVERTPDIMLLEGPAFEGGDSDMVTLYVVPDSLGDAAAVEGYKHWHLVRDLLLQGMQQFWMCLAALGGDPILLPRSEDPVEQKAILRSVVEKFVVWWDELCELEGRYYGQLWLPQPWPLWAGRIWRTCFELGMSGEQLDRLREVAPREAGNELRRWLAASASDDTAGGGGR
jgi:hypothetical protein